jgi:serine/threonine protein kinase
MDKAHVIANRFEVGDLIGQGGMGAVYRGRDTRSGQWVAIKQLKPELLTAGSEALERFRREVEALRRLDHPNIVKLIGTFREGKNYYIIMEYLGGGSLTRLLQSQPQLPIEQVLNIALDLSDALTRAHRLNIIHRDLKPDNVLLTEDGVPRLTDFGVALMTDQTRLTQSGSIIGTGAYLSPEACRGYELDARADVWAFGVMLYEMLTGQRPFAANASNPAATITAILMQPVPNLRQFRSDIPPALAMLVQQMLAKERELRISSTRQVGAQIELILNGEDAPPLMMEFDENTLPSQLLGLIEKWEARAYEATSQKASARSDAHMSSFHKAVAETYKAAAQDLREVLTQGGDANAEGDQPQVFVNVSRSEVEHLLERSRMKFSNIYEDRGSIFTVVFPKMPPIPFETRAAKLRDLASGIVILQTGTLDDTDQPYLDFGFTAPP